MAEEKRFVLYEYLSFFWRKKWWFLIIPVALAVILAVTAYAMNKGGQGYTGKVTVFTGSVSSLELTNPNTFIKGNFPDVDGLEGVVTSKANVKFTLEGDTAKEVEQQLAEVTEQYGAELNESAQTALVITENYSDIVKNRAEALRESLAMYEKKLAEPLPIDELEEYTRLATDSRNELTRAEERAYKLTSDFEQYEKPEVHPIEVDQKKTYVPQAIAIGLILGLVLTIVFLLLLKYLDYARSYYKSRGRLQD